MQNIADILVDPEGALERRNHWEKTSHAPLAVKSENERSGVLSTAMSFSGLYRDPTVATVTKRCDWRIADLVEGRHPVSLFLVVPPSDISRTKLLIRLLLSQIGAEVGTSL